MASKIDFDQLQTEIQDWVTHNFPNHRAWHPLLGTSEEVGELHHAYLKREQGIRGSYDEHCDAIKDAVGDIVIYLADFCNSEGIWLADCIQQAWDVVRERDWTRKE